MPKLSLSNSAYEVIRNKIISSELPQGMLVTEKLISDITNVSRTPAREAMDRLFREGWLENANGKSLCVNTVRSKHVEDIFQMRRMMELFAIDVVFQHGKSRLLAGKMDSILEEMAHAGESIIEFITRDFTFHTTTFITTGNNKMLSMWKTLGEEMVRMGILNMQGGKNRFEEVMNEHNAIIDALWNKDLERTKEAMLTHLRYSQIHIVAER